MGMNLCQYLSVNQNRLNGPRKNDSRLSYSTKYGVTFYDSNQMYIDCTTLLIYLIIAWFMICIKKEDGVDI